MYLTPQKIILLFTDHVQKYLLILKYYNSFYAQLLYYLKSVAMNLYLGNHKQGLSHIDDNNTVYPHPFAVHRSLSRILADFALNVFLNNFGNFVNFLGNF